MAEQARLRAEMRRRKLLAKSEERMRKVLGSSEDTSVTHKPALDDDWMGENFSMPEDKFDADDQEATKEQTETNNTLNEQRFRPTTSPVPQKESHSHVCNEIAFITGSVSRLCACPGLFFISFITLEVVALLPGMQSSGKTTSSFISLWTLIVSNFLSIDISNSKCFVVLSAVEASLQRLFIHSFSFILVHSLVEGFLHVH